MKKFYTFIKNKIKKIWNIIFNRNNFKKWYNKKTLLKIILGNLLALITRGFFKYLEIGVFLYSDFLFTLCITFIIGARAYLYIIIDSLDFSFDFSKFISKYLKKYIFPSMLPVVPNSNYAEQVFWGANINFDEVFSDLSNKCGGEIHKSLDNTPKLYSFNNNPIILPENVIFLASMNQKDKIHYFNLLLASDARCEAHKFISSSLDTLISRLDHYDVFKKDLQDLNSTDTSLLLKCVELVDMLTITDTANNVSIIDKDDMSLYDLKERLIIQKRGNVDITEFFQKRHDLYKQNLSVDTPDFEQREREMKRRMLNRVKKLPTKLGQSYYT